MRAPAPHEAELGTSSDGMSFIAFGERADHVGSEGMIQRRCGCTPSCDVRAAVNRLFRGAVRTTILAGVSKVRDGHECGVGDADAVHVRRDVVVGRSVGPGPEPGGVCRLLATASAEAPLGSQAQAPGAWSTRSVRVSVQLENGVRSAPWSHNSMPGISFAHRRIPPTI